jgi:hypothetical protein
MIECPGQPPRRRRQRPGQRGIPKPRSTLAQSRNSVGPTCRNARFERGAALALRRAFPAPQRGTAHSVRPRHHCVLPDLDRPAGDHLGRWVILPECLRARSSWVSLLAARLQRSATTGFGVSARALRYAGTEHGDIKVLASWRARRPAKPHRWRACLSYILARRLTVSSVSSPL